MVSSVLHDEPPVVPISYNIVGSSEHSGTYHAEHIKIDKPTDQASRWSGIPTGKVWLLLELESLCVLKSITFGKYQKAHPCNVKEFRLFIGLSEDHLVEVLHTTLKNDTTPETFVIPSSDPDGVLFPSRFVKLVALSSHRHGFHVSVWYLGIKGITESSHVQKVRDEYDAHREIVVMRHILKHLRQRRHISTYRQLLASTGVQLEHPAVTQFYDLLVLRGDWSSLDHELRQLSKIGLFNNWMQSCTPRAVWKRLYGLDPDGNAPSKRGGHAMCIDEERGLIYLFGGWDGQQSLDDFWVYNIKDTRWRLISPHVAGMKNGPGPRACHKMVFDRKTGAIYVLGRLSDDDFPTESEQPASPAAEGDAAATTETEEGGPASNDAADPPAVGYRGRRVVGTASTQSFCSEFYRYRTRGLDQGNWDLLHFDTAIFGGPPLLYDHQLVIDSETQIIYVYGGRVIDGDWEATKYSGLYSYDIRSSKWSLLSTPPAAHDNAIPPRFGHSMLLEPSSRRLYIFAGKQDDNYLSDMWEYDIATGTTTKAFADFTASGGPDACFAQRAVIDPELQELYIFAGLTKSRADALPMTTAGSTVWLYRYGKQTPGQWMRVLSNQHNKDEQIDDERARVPRARCAHQVVYDSGSKTVYMHGGNAGISTARNDDAKVDPATEVENRLDDFWSMTLKRPNTEEVIRRATLAIRCQQFREMCEESEAVKALSFLRTQVSSVVDHSNPEETDIFQSLLSHLLIPQSESPVNDQTVSPMPSASWPETPASEAGAPWTSELPTEDDNDMLDDFQTTDDDDRSTQPAYEREDTSRSWKTSYIDEDGASLSTERFKQRTEVFEKLLTFISPGAIQPVGNMIDMLSNQRS